MQLINLMKNSLLKEIIFIHLQNNLLLKLRQLGEKRLTQETFDKHKIDFPFRKFHLYEIKLNLNIVR